MATTTGYVQRLTLLQSSQTACAWVGPSPVATELLTIYISSGDSDDTACYKRSLINMLSEAQVSRRLVGVQHPDNSAGIEQVYYTAPDNTVPVQVDAVEATQSIQDLAHSIPLLAGKRTVIRVYLSHPGTPGITVRGEIAVRQGPLDVPYLIQSENVVVLEPTESGNIPVKREDVDRSLNFVLPATQEGPLAIEISSITNTVTNTDVDFFWDRKLAVWFHATAPLRLRIVGFRYLQNGVAYVPTLLDFALLQSWLGRAYPAGHLIATTTITDATANVPFGCGDINTQLAAMRVLDMDAGGDERTHYYGYVSDGGFFMRGCSAVPATPSPDAIGSGPTGPGTWGWDTDGSYGDWYGGHELGHTYGRKHPGFCGETKDDLDNYPFANGQLANNNHSFTGFDVGDPANGLPLRAYPGLQWHDVMTYCNREWLCAYTYLGIRRRLEAEDALGPNGSAGPAPGPGMPAPAFSSGGRPDARFPHSVKKTDEASMRLKEMTVNEEPELVSISVIATVNLTKPSGEIRSVIPLERYRAPKDVGKDAVLRVSSANGEVRNEFPVAVRLDSEIMEGEDTRGIIDAIIEVNPKSSLIELLVGSEVVDRYSIGGKTPQMKALRMEGVAEGVRVTGEAEETKEISGMTYAVQVSTDEGISWQTVAVGLKTPTTEINRSQFTPGQVVKVRVIATNGLQRSVVMSESFRI